MQLGDAEAVGVHDDHHSGVGDVDADLDDRGGDEDLGLTVSEAIHDGLLLIGVQPRMKDVDAQSCERTGGQLRSDLLDRSRRRATTLDVVSVIAADTRTHHEDLMPGLALLSDALPGAGEPRAVGWQINHSGLDVGTSGRQFSQGRHLEITEDRHGNRARNRRCSENELVRSSTVTSRQDTALLDAEAVLLVHDDQTDVVVDDLA